MRIARGISIVNTSKPISTAAAYDADAAAYFTANTAITSTADKTAINNFYLGLKSDGIYTKIKAMYLPIWGSASACKWNLVNPLDTNSAYRLTFANGITFTSSGMTGNGTSGYANTNLLASVVNTTNHLSFYSRTSAVNTEIEMGVYIADGSGIINQLRLATNYNAGNAFTGTGNVNFTTTTDARGFWIGTKRASNDRECYLNGVSQATSTTSDANNLPNGNIYILARNQISPNGVFFYSTKQCAFSSIGDGLTDTESANFSNRVNTLLTYFGVNIY